MYQALYRKYRPKTFDDVVGQKSVTDTLKTQLSTGRLSHAYLFTGTRGTGKTSCAKILAKAVNCEHPREGNPCNACPSCRAIDSGGCMDVLEIDAASNNGVDNVRSLRDDAVYTPSEVRRRVYIIDEVHMLSIAAFNALLKIIEEPPEHLVFILATTEVHKIPATILSRCQRFSFKRLLPEDIEGRLLYVAAQERIALEPDAARVLARLADGAMRDALSLLDQCACTGGKLDAGLVYERLGLAGNRQTAALLSAIAEQDAPRAISLFSSLYAQGKDVAAMLGELCALSRDLLILKTAPRSGVSLLSGANFEELAPLQDRLSASELLRITSLLQKTASGFSQSADKRLDTELCLLELCSPSLRLDAPSLSARIGRVEQALASGAVVRPAPPLETQPEPDPKDEANEEPKPEEPLPAGDELPPGFWRDLVEAVAPKLPPSCKGFLRDQTVPALQGNVLELQADSPFLAKQLDKEPLPALVREQAALLLKRPVTLRITARRQAAGDLMQNLIEYGKKHPDVIDIRGEQ